MSKVIIKKNGQQVRFDGIRIENAIIKAFINVDGTSTTEAMEIARKIANTVEKQNLESKEPMTVEQIQTEVIKLLKAERPDVGRAYNTYAEMQKSVHQAENALMDAIASKLNATNVQNQNANVDEYSFGGRMGEARDIITKKYALDRIMSTKSRKNHEHNRIYIHDLNSYAVGQHNCLSVPFDKLLAKGVVVRGIHVRPAKSIGSALQLVAVIFQLQSLCQFGGVSATHIDWTMVPYVQWTFRKRYLLNYIKSTDEIMQIDFAAMSQDELDDWVDDNKERLCTALKVEYMDITMDNKDKLDKHLYQAALFDTRIDVYQAVEAMYHNLNTLQSRSGDQLPFTSINYGTCTSQEGRMVTKALLECLYKGVGVHYTTSIFPCGIFQLGKGINRAPQDPNYDLYQLALKCTAQRLYPNYANIDWSGNAGYDKNDPKTYFSTMGCRTANGWDINGMEQTKDGRGNICPVTIIMPTIAMEAKMNLKVGEDLGDAFLQRLDTAISDAKDMLIERFEHICAQSPKAAPFMWENGTMEGYIPEQGIRSALRHGTLALGQLGLAETLQILMGCDQTVSTGMEFAKKIEQLFKDRCAEFKKQYSLNFGVYYTPECNV